MVVTSNMGLLKFKEIKIKLSSIGRSIRKALYYRITNSICDVHLYSLSTWY
jgi:hypothetical protein